MSESGNRSGGRRFSLANSGLLTALVLALGLTTLGLVWHAHLHGKLHKLSTTTIPPEAQPQARPGGQDLLELQHMAQTSTDPQFSNARIMPGVGMGLLQLSLATPDGDTMDVLHATPLAEVAKSLTPEKNEPTPSLLFAPFSMKVYPADGSGPGEELLGKRPALESRNDILPGGNGATGDFPSEATTPESGTKLPPSGIESRVSYTLSSRGLDIAISAKNVSQQPRAVVIAWTPQFKVPDSGMQSIRIVPPDTTASTNNRSATSEFPLGTAAVQRTWTGLRYSYLSTGPELRLKNLGDGYALRMIALTPSIRSIRLEAPRSGSSVSVRFGSDADGNKTVIDPGDSLQWRLRILPIPTDGYTPLSE